MSETLTKHEQLAEDVIRGFTALFLQNIVDDESDLLDSDVDRIAQRTVDAVERIQKHPDLKEEMKQYLVGLWNEAMKE